MPAGDNGPPGAPAAYPRRGIERQLSAHRSGVLYALRAAQPLVIQ